MVQFIQLSFTFLFFVIGRAWHVGQKGPSFQIKLSTASFLCVVFAGRQEDKRLNGRKVGKREAQDVFVGDAVDQIQLLLLKRVRVKVGIAALEMLELNANDPIEDFTQQVALVGRVHQATNSKVHVAWMFVSIFEEFNVLLGIESEKVVQATTRANSRYPI